MKRILEKKLLQGTHSQEELLDLIMMGKKLWVIYVYIMRQVG